MTIAKKLVEGLGGAQNIEELESCIVRIRAIVSEPALVSEAVIRETSPIGVVSSGRYVQIIVGPSSDDLVDEMNRTIKATAFC
ncbi:PTS transporter subunit EIIB [Gleimia europaea]|uniref:PTS system, glucose-like IIB component n=1 Tax=Gleimia europaea ACS-120-V-Col10b TaxID=883069 RepID=A0A9W5RE88_9ACTO|nr:PTS transporter subunit EIIB [Gleimia europaea]EPD30705.1 PTS system, glucose-like IIB component [Gleimia europaea ACS-120-V-Col10b]